MQRVYSHVAELRNLSQTLHGIPSRIKNPSPLEGTLYRIHSKIPSPSVHISLKQKWREAWITFVVLPDPVPNNVWHVQSGFWKRFCKLVWQLLWDFQGYSQLECNSVSVWCTYLGSSLTSFVHSMGGAHTWYEMKIPVQELLPKKGRWAYFRVSTVVPQLKWSPPTIEVTQVIQCNDYIEGSYGRVHHLHGHWLHVNLVHASRS